MWPWVQYVCVACLRLWWMTGCWVMAAASTLRLHRSDEAEETAERSGWCGCMALGVPALCVHGRAFGRRSWSAASSCVLLTNTMTSASVSDASALVLICAAVWFLSLFIMRCFAVVVLIAPHNIFLYLPFSWSIYKDGEIIVFLTFCHFNWEWACSNSSLKLYDVYTERNVDAWNIVSADIILYTYPQNAAFLEIFVISSRMWNRVLLIWTMSSCTTWVLSY